MVVLPMLMVPLLTVAGAPIELLALPTLLMELMLSAPAWMEVWPV